MKFFDIYIYGRVQGIGFRKRIENYCLDNNLNGFTENLRNGSVHIFLKSSDKDLENFVDWLKTNPGVSLINNIRVKLGKEIKLDGFNIKKENYLIDKTESFYRLVKYYLGFSDVLNYVRKIPVHVSIIPDGNRRWAVKKGFFPSKGHYVAGDRNVLELIQEAKRIGIKYLSIWAFSTENWKRSEEEINAIFEVVKSGIKKLDKASEKEKIRFIWLGRRDRVPKDLKVKLENLETKSKHSKEFNFVLCLDYGGRDEILRTVNKILSKKVKKVDESIFRKHLDSFDIPDPDLIIRTSGENRVSGFMPFQAAYSEFYFVKKFFPDFTIRDFDKAIIEYDRRERRVGK